MHRRLVLSSVLPIMALFLSAALPSLAQDKAAASELGQDDYEIAATVLKYVYPKGAKDSVMIAPHLATFACNPPVDNGFSMGGCSGMRTADVEPDDVMYSVRAAMPAVTAELASRLVQKGKETATLTHTFPVPIEQFLAGPDKTPSNGLNPELAFYMSRAAVADSGSKALIYVGVVSWRDQSQSQGRYFYLEKSKHGWSVKDTFVLWTFGS